MTYVWKYENKNKQTKQNTSEKLKGKQQVRNFGDLWAASEFMTGLQVLVLAGWVSTHMHAEGNAKIVYYDTVHVKSSSIYTIKMVSYSQGL